MFCKNSETIRKLFTQTYNLLWGSTLEIKSPFRKVLNYLLLPLFSLKYYNAYFKVFLTIQLVLDISRNYLKIVNFILIENTDRIGEEVKSSKTTQHITCY